MAQLGEHSLGVLVFRDGGIHHHFKHQIFGSSGRNGILRLERFSSLLSKVRVIVGMDKGLNHFEDKDIKSFFVGSIPVIDVGFIQDPVESFLCELFEAFSGNRPSDSNSLKVDLYEGCQVK